MPVLSLTDDASQLLVNYSWPGNVRQLKNITEQMSVLEEKRIIDADALLRYLPSEGFNSKPMVVGKGGQQDFTEREILYKVLFEMKNDLNDLKKLVLGMIQSGGSFVANQENEALFEKVFNDEEVEQEASSSFPTVSNNTSMIHLPQSRMETPTAHTSHEEVEESLSLSDSEKDLIKKALSKHKNKRKYAAEELGISERTLYRKIKEYNLGK
jgi:transcriptional regulator with PAS, ATPase and Fis domain